MKQLLILSGKGGTGKTTIASAFIKLANAQAFADCDVDAPNLHIIMNQMGEPIRSDYYGLDKARIIEDQCIGCGICRQNCRFDAILEKDGVYEVDPFGCEGCSVCEALCPVKAVEMLPAVAGELMLYKKDKAVFSTAQLKMGSGTSGMLVTRVKNQMKDAADHQTEMAIIDGSPGIGCPVIASLSGVDMVLIVAEPSLSGISDMERIVKTARQFGVKMAICVNKYDINLNNTQKIEDYCGAENIVFAGTVPFDENAGKAINRGLSVIDIPCPAQQAVETLFSTTMELLRDK
ncbi:MAG: ATPase [Negativicutes bacterium]|nr:ATPase [Negativicutes bacterium]